MLRLYRVYGDVGTLDKYENRDFQRRVRVIVVDLAIVIGTPTKVSRTRAYCLLRINIIFFQSTAVVDYCALRYRNA